MKRTFSFSISALAFVAHTLDAAAAERESPAADVVIYGATPAGICAALAAAAGTGCEREPFPSGNSHISPEDGAKCGALSFGWRPCRLRVLGSDGK